MLKTDKPNADNSTKMYLDIINMLLYTWAPLKIINKYKLKFMSKPCITLGLQKSISMRNRSLVNYPVLKEEFHTDYKKIYKFIFHLHEKK